MNTLTRLRDIEKALQIVECCEINQGNYKHEEVCNLNNAYIEMSDSMQNALTLISELIAEQENGGWLPIQSAPKDGSNILLGSEYGDVASGSWIQEWTERQEYVRTAKDGEVYKTIKSDEGYWQTDSSVVTHWQPLPTSPIDKQGEV